MELLDNSAIQFILVTVALLSGWMLWSLRKVNKRTYFMTQDGRGILKGIFIVLAFCAVGLLVGSLAGCSTGTYFNDASIYAGLDYTKKESPSCVAGSVDDRSTSNVGIRGNLYESSDGKFRTNLKYTHHSCGFGLDSAQYDAIGAELEYIFWSR